ncbi:dihydroxyacetone kinase phosphoryl donor subunit DhaM [Curtobacterium aurantiacum]|uniref:dihydroxyacetone kinase phosphoryl donor subunit DhaM n=1 Tax=Curtobacterium aurantiacum TaxID=3236919 RepID=UPI001BDE0BB6|nr:dihydroxyacetone kinase phosphoryl donor subunit DhaM [Curtobacterium flaccumfaciens]MBT1681278.1 PTS-dependent dihydroxyacetone kinase phosphotransferase subunit DhaM [Curtobacterium flaccumfaciens pv. flaccumfaciens]
MTVGILVVSHSAAIATGTVELARQMAADVPLVAAGGTDDGGIGTSFEAITAGIEELADSDAVVVLCDLGSAYLTTDTALDFLDDDVRARVHVSQAPLVEGTVAAAVAAQTGGDADTVLAAAASAAGSEADASSASSASGASGASGDEPGGPVPVDGAAPVDEVAGSDRVSASVELVNETGLHARPAAEFVKTAAKYDAAVHVNGVDAKSLLAIMALALPKGATVSIDATGQDAQAAVDALVELVRSGFGE